MKEQVNELSQRRESKGHLERGNNDMLQLYFHL